MNQSVPVSISQFEDQLKLAERELSAFFTAVKTLFGPDQATQSVEDWLDAIGQVLAPYQPHYYDWRAVTIVASSRLGQRLTVAPSKVSRSSQFIERPNQASSCLRFCPFETRLRRPELVKDRLRSQIGGTAYVTISNDNLAVFSPSNGKSRKPETTLA